MTTQTDNGQSAIEIEPANPQVIYVPDYDPAYIWGPPAFGYYPDLFYPGFGFGFWPGIDVGLCFGGWGWGPWGGWGAWGRGPNWFGGGLFVNGGFFRHYGFGGGYGGIQGVGAWAHNPAHRLGVGYPNGQLAQRYDAASRANVSRMGSRYTGGQTFGASRGAQAGGQFGNRFAGQSYQGYRGSMGQNFMRGYQSRPSFQSAPRYSAPGFGGGMRSFGGSGFGGGAHGFGGGGFGGGGHSFGGGGHGR